MAGVISRLIKIVCMLGLLASLLSGCGAPAVVQETYPLESVNRSGDATSYVYRASNQSVPEVADALTAQRTPEQISPVSSERMFLVYGSQWYHLQQDPQIPQDTLVEVDSEAYVRNNYDTSFLQMYLTARLLGSLFNGSYGTGAYRGYGAREVYQPRQGTYRKPTPVDYKIAPPVTIVRKGQLTRRGQSGGITGGRSGIGNPDQYSPPSPRLSRPTTRFRTGRIGRRGRR